MKLFSPSSTFQYLFIISLFLYSCGNPEKPEETKSKTSIEDLYNDNRPEYDKSKIDPNAEIVNIEIKATGLTMSDMSYQPKSVTVKSGTTVHLKLINTSTDSAMPHNWVLVYDGTMEYVATAGLERGVDNNYVPISADVLLSTKLLAPLEEIEITFPAPPKGTYQFVCTYPGHWSLMNGTFTVE